MENKIKIGAIRWDAWYGHDGVETSIISNVERTLSPAKYHHRAPFFAKVTEDNKIIVPEYTQEIFDTEMKLAIDAGIDYFTYVWYYDEMKTARQMFSKSKYNNQIKMSVCLGGKMLFDGLEEIIRLFKQDFFMTVDGGRPLVYYFGGFASVKEGISILKEECAKNGIPTPYSVVMNLGVEDTVNAGADAIGQYGVAASNGVPFDGLRQEAKKLWQKFYDLNMQFIPTVSCGWHNVPRHENPVKWLTVNTPDSWAQYPTGEDLYEHVTEALAYMERDDVKPKTKIRTLSMYAWNEHDEGGWICPTIAVDSEGRQLFNDDGTPKINSERLDGVKRAIKEYKER